MNELFLILFAGFFILWAFHSLMRKFAWGFWYYRIYLNSIHWRIKRWMKMQQRRILNRDILSCEKCGNKKRLIIHHITYERLWRERLSDLQVLCRNCHRPGGGRI